MDMERIFLELTRAIEGQSLIAVGAAFVWGVLSIILSPCHIGSIPLVIGYIAGQELSSTRRAFWVALSFASGILVTIAVVGLLTAAVGHMIGELGKLGNYLVAIVMFIVGLYLLDFFSVNLACRTGLPSKLAGAKGGFILGLLFGLALGPCTFAYMAPMLAITFKVGASNLLFGSFLLLMYGIGHCAVIVLAGTFTELVEKWLKLHSGSKALTVFRYVCGVLLLITGVILIYKA